MKPREIENSYLWDISSQVISLDTVSANSNAKCAELIGNRLFDLGFEVAYETFDDHGHIKQQVIATIGPKVEDGIILSGHIDTVPFANQPGWTKDALTLTLDGDKIFGRGTVDMKLFITQCLAAFKELNLDKLKKPIVCIFTADEEVGCLGACRLKTKINDLLLNTPLPKRALIGEPTSFDIVNTHKGIVHFDLNIHGVAGHSSRPDLGKNAIAPLGKIIEIVNALNLKYQNEIDPELRKLFSESPYNYLHMAQIDAGLAINMIPELCSMRLSYRCFPSEDPHRVLNDFKNQLKSIDSDLNIEVSNLHTTPAMPMAMEPELEKVLLDYCQTKLVSVPFATDGCYLSEMGVQSYICGPGETKMAHQPDEYMPLTDFIQGPEFIKNILLNTVY